MRPVVIVGVDPGTTAAYVALNLQGEIVSRYSGKEFSCSQLITHVTTHGRPVLVATDKAKTPSFVYDVATKLGCILVGPEEDLKKSGKKMLVHQHGFTQKLTAHEFDACAAACLALKKYKPRIKKIKRYLAKHDVYKPDQFVFTALQEELPFEVIHQRTQRYNTPIMDLRKEKIESGTMAKEPQIKNENHATGSDQTHSPAGTTGKSDARPKPRKKNHALLIPTDDKKLLIQKLRKQVRELKKRTKDVDKQINRVFFFKDNRIRALRQEIRLLKKQCTSTKELMEQQHVFLREATAYTIVKKLLTLGKQRVHEFRTGDVVWIENTAIFSAQLIEELSAKSVLVCSPRIPAFLEPLCKTQLLDPSQFYLELEHFALVPPKSIMNIDIQDIVDTYRSRRQEEGTH